MFCFVDEDKLLNAVFGQGLKFTPVKHRNHFCELVRYLTNLILAADKLVSNWGKNTSLFSARFSKLNR